jgi:hypothetical protein
MEVAAWVIGEADRQWVGAEKLDVFPFSHGPEEGAITGNKSTEAKGKI